MAEIIKTYRQSVGAMRLIGKKYANSDRVNGTFGEKWGEWFQNGWFNEIKRLPYEALRLVYEEYEATIGLVRGDGEAFEYWIGMFMPENTAVPEGFECIDFPKGELGVCWIYGNESEVYMQEARCLKKLEEEGFIITGDCFERYSERFHPDEKGNVTLDICFYVQNEGSNKS